MADPRELALSISSVSFSSASHFGELCVVHSGRRDLLTFAFMLARTRARWRMGIPLGNTRELVVPSI